MTAGGFEPNLYVVTPLIIRALGVVHDFDEFGGASAELVSWELGVDSTDVTGPWERAIQQGYLTPAPPDHVLGEQMFRITTRGREALVGELARMPQGA
jgi:hypothetical protein